MKIHQKMLSNINTKQECASFNSNESNCKLLYAWNENEELVHVNSVLNGKACNCICPKCKEPLIARNGGQKREHHFAHSRDSKCKGAYETALHLLAKDILKEEKKITVPEYKINNDIMKSYLVEFDDIEVEQRNDSIHFQPDCVGVTKKKVRIAIEICVTNALDEEKCNKIKLAGLDCIEITISRNSPMDKNKLKELIIQKTECKKWINCPSGYSYLQKKKINKKSKTNIGFYNSKKAKLEHICKNYDKYQWATKIVRLPLSEIINKVKLVERSVWECTLLFEGKEYTLLKNEEVNYIDLIFYNFFKRLELTAAFKP